MIGITIVTAFTFPQNFPVNQSLKMAVLYPIYLSGCD